MVKMSSDNTIVVLIIIFTIMYWLLKPICTKLTTYKFDSGRPGPHILLVGTSHGNEPAASVGFQKLADMFSSGDLSLAKGKLTIIPCLNPCGKKMHIRWLPHQLFLLHSIDLNRNYAKSLDDEGSCTISRKIERLSHDVDLIIDGHEGYDFVKINPKSMGSAVYAGKHPLSQSLVPNMVSDLNKTITSKPKGVNKKRLDKMKVEDFQFISHIETDLPGTLRWYSDNHDIPYVLIETTGLNDIQPLDVRSNQHLILALSALRQLGML